MIEFPLCQKCYNAIVEWREEYSLVFEATFRIGSLTGCTQCAKIKSFEDAKKLCPLLGKKGQNRE